MPRRLLLPMVLLVLTSCDDQPLGVPKTTDGLVYTPDWDGVTAFFDDACASCHSAGGSAETVPLPDAVHFDLATETRVYVVPNDPAGSSLWRLVSGELAEGDYGAMPLGSGPLAGNQIDHVRLWIEAGAPFPPLDLDLDGDGHPGSVDCDDSDPAIHPGATEVCDPADVDEDCDGVADGADADGARAWYRDQDGDGYGATDDTASACSAPAGYVGLDGDCNDADPAFNPGAIESDCADPTDYNCDGSSGSDDGDGDGFFACQECNDADPASFPGADETCDGADNDCDGSVDEDAVDAFTWWTDGDGDGYGGGASFLDCSTGSGWVDNGDDCNDADAAVSPVAVELADGIDNDCDGQIDEAAGAVSFATSIQPIITGSCTVNCHGAAPGPASGGLNLTSNPYGRMVGIASQDVPSMSRIEPGDPANSYVWHKLNDTQGQFGPTTGQQMPLNAGPLSAGQLATIEAWILGGALP